MKSRKIVAILTASFVLAMPVTPAYSQPNPVKAAIALSKLLTDTSDTNKGLRALLENEDLFTAALETSSEGSFLTIIQKLTRDDSNSVRAGEMQNLATEMAKALEKASEEKKAALIPLFVAQLQLIASADQEKLSTFEVSGLLVIDQNLNQLSEPELIAQAKVEIEALNKAIADFSTPTEALSNIVLSRSAIASSARVAGSLAMEFLFAQSASAKKVALETLEGVVGKDRVNELIGTLGSIGDNLGKRTEVEKEIFMQKIRNEPLFLASVISGIGTGLVGIATGRPYLVLTSLWGIFGSRIMANLPINQMLWMLATSSTELLKIANPVEREEMLANMKAKFSQTSTVIVDKILQCGATIGDECKRLSENPEGATTQIKETVGALFEKGTQTVSSTADTVKNAINSNPKAAAAVETGSRWFRLARAQAERACGNLLNDGTKQDDNKKE